MSSLTQFFGGSIKSIQRGTITIAISTASQTATISSVDTSKSELRFLGETVDGSPAVGALANALSRVVLTNSTTITATRGAAATVNTVVSWELTEWN